MLNDIPLPRRGQSITPQDRARLASLLTSNQTALGLILSAKQLPQARYPIDLRQGAATLLPHLAKAKSAVLLLTAQAYLQSVDGNSQEATESLAAAGQVADSLASEPIVVSSVVRMTCWNIIVDRMELVLNNTSLTDDQLTRLEKLLAEAERPDALARSLAGERCLALAFPGDPSPSQVTTNAWNGDGIIPGLVKLTRLPQRDQAFFLDIMATNIAAAELPYSERFQASKSAAATIFTQSNRFFVFSRAFLPALANLHETDAKHTARVRVARTALAVQRYRRSHGNATPESLEQLAPGFMKDTPEDPIDGRILRYKKTDAGFVIYSLGVDEKDDGGIEFDGSIVKSGQDIMFIVER